MGKNAKENRDKKKKRAQMQFWAAKASFVAGIIVMITIGKDLYEYIWDELPILVSAIIVGICLLLFFLILGTDKFDKVLSKSKGVENYGTFLTVCSVLVFIFENTLLKTEMSVIEILGLCLIYAVIVVGAVWLLFTRYKRD